MSLGPVLTVHLLCATLFFGIVAFEVLVLEGIRRFLPPNMMMLVEEGIHTRARKFMPYVVALLFLSGGYMAYGYYDGMGWDVFSSPFGILLAVKIALALSVLVHFILALKYALCGSMTSTRFRFTHLSVFIHMLAILILAKGIHYITW